MTWRTHKEPPKRKGRYIVVWVGDNGEWESNTLYWIEDFASGRDRWHIRVCGQHVLLPEQHKHEYWYQSLPTMEYLDG